MPFIKQLMLFLSNGQIFSFKLRNSASIFTAKFTTILFGLHHFEKYWKIHTTQSLYLLLNHSKIYTPETPLPRASYLPSTLFNYPIFLITFIWISSQMEWQCLQQLLNKHWKMQSHVLNSLQPKKKKKQTLYHHKIKH